MNQKAEVNQNSTAIQVAGNLNCGLSLTECTTLFNLLLNENFPKLQDQAAKQAQANVETLVNATYKKLESRIDKIDIGKLAQPDVQYVFNLAVQGAAKKGDKIDIDLLAELLEARLQNENTDYLDACIEASIEIVPKLTIEMISLLPAIHFIQSLGWTVFSELDGIYKNIDTNFLSKCQDITQSKLRTIASLGAGTHSNVKIGGDTYNKQKLKHPELEALEMESKLPNMLRVLKFYDDHQLHQLTLTTAGQIIAVKMLQTLFPRASLKDCIH